MIDKEWISNLASDIIEQNCLCCSEFRKPLAASDCWCPVIVDIVDNELYTIDECTEDSENLVAAEWELIRNELLKSGDE
jgi:hypothetical protein